MSRVAGWNAASSAARRVGLAGRADVQQDGVGPEHGLAHAPVVARVRVVPVAGRLEVVHAHEIAAGGQRLLHVRIGIRGQGARQQPIDGRG
jgi:hypothetical protein